MRSLCGVSGVRCAGTKEGKFGLALIEAPGESAAVFTRNVAKAAPILLMQERIKRGRLEAILVNSGCANALTGRRGQADAMSMAEIAAEKLSCSPDAVGVASTGVIGRYLDLPRIEKQCSLIAPRLSRSPAAESDTAAAIMTTDTYPKHALVKGEQFSIGGICKGSGMIAPNMGTMLAFLYTDAAIPACDLKDMLSHAVTRSFNQVVVDGDTSTNDVCFLTATGSAGRVDNHEFEKVLLECCTLLAKQIAADGEGASRMIEVIVTNAGTETDAREVAKTIVGSPLVKSAIYGQDPNWGRIIAAAGRAGVSFDPDAISCWIGAGQDRAPVCIAGTMTEDLRAAKQALDAKQVVIELDLQEGEEKATAWGCDLTEEYVVINGKYTT
ncbi:MAG: bifunctional glutamate N-acetyltransferase/amino-acid acetyltransferase ArgJ [Methanospirillaceae archaeon]|nr:bifunctional glutamate N-acetyltransferase/amino-acid acetyltransferase ArgJ [Methanospirillaceae archaeon]